METILGSSWRSTLIGFILAIVTYFHELGPNLPETTHEWLGAAMAAGIGAFAKVVKDWNVTNATFVSPAAVRPETPIIQPVGDLTKP